MKTNALIANALVNYTATCHEHRTTDLAYAKRTVDAVLDAPTDAVYQTALKIAKKAIYKVAQNDPLEAIKLRDRLRWSRSPGEVREERMDEEATYEKACR